MSTTMKKPRAKARGTKAKGQPKAKRNGVRAVADDGSFPRRLRASIYLARAANPSPPSRRYLDALVRGARHHRLPDDYVRRLAATAVVD